MTSVQKHSEQVLATALKEIGESEAVKRFLTKYGNVRTRAAYSYWLSKYLQWLKDQGITLSPDALIKDNLECVFNSDAVDVRTKRRHTDWLSTFVNEYLIKQGNKEATRRLVSACVKEYYKRNDSELFGDFSVASQPFGPSAKALRAEDIRTVLKSLPLNIRAPLIMEWQSGVEINRVLAFKWAGLQWKDSITAPLRLDFYGRKTHRREYCTFIGTDTVNALKTLGVRTEYLFPGKRGLQSEFAWLNHRLKLAASKLMKEKLIQDYSLSSWRSHMLRHSFETEASHAGVRMEIRNYFLGHVSGIEWVYHHTDEVHPEDLVAEYRKIEPFVSLDQTEATMKNEFDDERESWLKELMVLKDQVRSLMSGSSPRASAVAREA
jgi:integrase